MADQIPGATFVCLKGDHFLAAKRPQIFNWVVKRFLEEETFFSVERDRNIKMIQYEKRSGFNAIVLKLLRFLLSIGNKEDNFN